MYISVQFIILEILLGLIFLAVLYFMLRDLLKKIIRKELEETKEHVKILASYLVQVNEEELDDDAGDVHQGTGQNAAPGGMQPPREIGKGTETGASPEKLVALPVDVADEFVALKNANRINAYNLQVQKIWELYKNKKITIKQYNEELVRLKKEYGIALDETDMDKTGIKPSALTKVKSLTPPPATKATPIEETATGKDQGKAKKEAAAEADSPPREEPTPKQEN